MNYPCKLIQDLLPLYHDGVCSAESREIIAEHLSDCAECSKALKEIRGAELVDVPADFVRETKKADSMKKIKRRLLRKQILISAAALAAAAAILFGVSLSLMLNGQTVNAENVSVHMIGGDIVCRLRGSCPSGAHIKNVKVSSDGGEKYYMFFSVNESKWDRLIMSNNKYTELVLAFSETGAQSIERVYYYPEDDAGIEMLPEDEFQKIMEQSTLMWSK